MNKWIQYMAFGLAVSCATAQAGIPVPSTTNTVLSLTGKISVVTQGDEDSIEKVSITQNDIINLARGRSRVAAVPANEVLALANDCDEGPVKLIVFDTNTSSNLVELSSTTSVVGVEEGTKSVNGIAFDINSVGASENGIASGLILLTLNATQGTNGCPNKITGAIAGTLQVITSEPDLSTNDLLITKGKVAGGTVGTLIEPIIP